MTPRTLLILVLAIRVLWGSSYAQASDITFDSLRSGIVKIAEKQADGSLRWLGTGFHVRRGCTFATAKHLLKDADKKRLMVRFLLPENRTLARTVSASVAWQSATRDLALLRIETYRGKPCTSDNLHVFQLVERPPTSTYTGKSVWIIGHPVLGDPVDIPVLRAGTLASAEGTWGNEPMLLLDLIGVPGYSGSPVIALDTGKVFGVVYGPGPSKRVFGFEWATPITKDVLAIESSLESEDNAQR